MEKDRGWTEESYHRCQWETSVWSVGITVRGRPRLTLRLTLRVVLRVRITVVLRVRVW